MPVGMDDLPRPVFQAQPISRLRRLLVQLQQRIGQFLIDDNFLAANGIDGFDQYHADPTQKLAQDFFVPDDIPPPKGVNIEVGFR